MAYISEFEKANNTICVTIGKANQVFSLKLGHLTSNSENNIR